MRTGLAILRGAAAGLAAQALGLVVLFLFSPSAGMFESGYLVLSVLAGAVAGAVGRRVDDDEPSLAAFGAWGLWGAALVGLMLSVGPGELDAPTILILTLVLGLVGAFLGRAPWRDA